MIRKNSGPIEWLEFRLLSQFPEIVHGVFLRHGGVSQNTCSSLNMLKGIGDDVNALQNREMAAKCLGLQTLVSGRQVHGSKIEHVTAPLEEVFGVDGLITSKKEVGLLALHADCQAAIFYDPVHQAIGTVHAGWRGQVQNIYGEMVQKMGVTFGTRPKDLFVCISPSLGPENGQFIHYQKELPQEFWTFQIKPTYFDLWAISRDQLENCGIPSDQIEIAAIDTHDNSHDFFSYRREKKLGRTEQITGGHGTIVALKKET